MTRCAQWKSLLIASAALLWLGASPASAAPILVNGGFEGGLTGWTVDNLFPDFGAGSFSIQSGTTSPVTGLAVQAPPEGSSAAMSDGDGPGTHVLYQDFVVPSSVADATLNFSLFVQNTGPDFYTPAPDSLDWSSAAPNQQVRVDLMLTSADPFSLDVLLNLLQTASGDSLVSGYTPYSFDISSLLAAHAGQTLRLRFTDVNNVAIQNVGVDAVGIEVNSAPEPTALVLLATGLTAAAIRRRQRF